MSMHPQGYSNGRMGWERLMRATGDGGRFGLLGYLYPIKVYPRLCDVHSLLDTGRAAIWYWYLSKSTYVRSSV